MSVVRCNAGVSQCCLLMMKADVPAGRWKLWMDANFCQQKRKRYTMTLKVVIISQMHSIHNTERKICLLINSLSLAVIDRCMFPCISEDFPRQPIGELWYVVDITDANVQQWCDAIMSTWDEFQHFVFCTWNVDHKRVSEMLGWL